MMDDLRHGHALKVIDLTTWENSREDLVLLRSSKDKDHVCWRFLQRFEESIESSLREHVDLIDDKDLIFACLWRNESLLHECLDILHGVVARGIELENIHRASFVESTATLTLVAGLTVLGRVFTVNGLGKNTGTSRLSHTTRTAEKIGMRQFPRFHRIFQCRGQRILANHRRESHWPVFPCGNNIIVHRIAYMNSIIWIAIANLHKNIEKRD